MPVVTSSSVTPAAAAVIPASATATKQGLSFLDILFSLKKGQRFNPHLFPEELSGEDSAPDEAAPFSHGDRERKRDDSSSHLSLEGLSRGEGTPETVGPNRRHDELPPYSQDDGSGFPFNSEGLEHLPESEIDELLGIDHPFDFGDDDNLYEEEEQGTKAGAYSLEERRAKIAKFLEKRERRVWKRNGDYEVRREFAKTRPRVRGRFIPGAAAKRQRM